jgi:hypothetical protein
MGTDIAIPELGQHLCYLAILHLVVRSGSARTLRTSRKPARGRNKHGDNACMACADPMGFQPFGWPTMRGHRIENELLPC